MKHTVKDGRRPESNKTVYDSDNLTKTTYVDGKYYKRASFKDLKAMNEDMNNRKRIESLRAKKIKP